MTMAESDVLFQYLRGKFSSILQEAESDPSSPSHIISRFRSIERTINFMSENSTSPIPVNQLYKLIDTLSECRSLAHRRPMAAASKKSFFWVITIRPLSEFFFWKKVREVKKQLVEIEDHLKNRQESDKDWSASSGSELVIQQTYPVLDTSRIFGFKAQAKEIEGWLIDNLYRTEGLTAIGITGRCGCGKTALAQKVFASSRIQEEFSPRIWVCLANMLFEQKGVDTRVRVLNYILEEIGYDISELEYADFGVNELLEKLHSGLMGKRYLIVLDNAWRVDEWYADLGQSLPRGSSTAGELLTHGLPKGSGGGVIVTSRRENVIRRTVGEKRVIRLLPDLANNDAIWDIFANVVQERGGIQVNHPTLMTIKDDVIKNCDGLPLAARTLAHIVRAHLIRREAHPPPASC